MPFKLIRPKPINKAAIINRLRKVMVNESNAVYTDYQQTIKTWVKVKPKFVIRIKDTFGSIEFFVGTDNQVYYMLDITGAVAHPIVARRAKALRYPGDFTPKTKVGVIGSQPGGRTGDVVVRISVQHPGFDARKFSEAIASKSQKRLLQEAEKAMKDIVGISGHR